MAGQLPVGGRPSTYDTMIAHERSYCVACSDSLVTNVNEQVTAAVLRWPTIS